MNSICGHDRCINGCVGRCDEIATLLCNIIRLQREAVREELQEEMCDGKRLGCGSKFKCNTRPIEVFTDDDEPWRTPICRNDMDCQTGEDGKTCVFRAEKIEKDAVVLRALVRDGDHKFLSTDSFITIRLDKIAAIRCLKDTFVNICII